MYKNSHFTDNNHLMIDPILLKLEKSTNQTINQMQKRDIERTQLMIALYLGVGITIFLILVGVCVECIRKRYYGEDDADTSLDSYDELSTEIQAKEQIPK